jgi:alpha-glucosidase
MTDVPVPPGEWQDPQGLNMPHLNLSRDPCRTPMQWDDTVYAGFSENKPWLPVAENFTRVNVKVQVRDPTSFLVFYKRLIELRQSEPALFAGAYRSVFSDRQMLAYVRTYEDRRFMIVLNLTHRAVYFSPSKFPFHGIVELSTEPERNGTEVRDSLGVSGDEALVIRLIS